MQKEQTESIHIGNMIRRELERQGCRTAWFDGQINCDRSNAYKILKRRNIDVQLLIRISEVLGHNFLDDCARKVR